MRVIDRMEIGASQWKYEKPTLPLDALCSVDWQFFIAVETADHHLGQFVLSTLRYLRIEITLRDFSCACPRMIWACMTEGMGGREVKPKSKRPPMRSSD